MIDEVGAGVRGGDEGGGAGVVAHAEEPLGPARPDASPVAAPVSASRVDEGPPPPEDPSARTARPIRPKAPPPARDEGRLFRLVDSGALPEGLVEVLAPLFAVPDPAPIILIDGLSGAGKSSLARALADASRTGAGGEIRVLGSDLWLHSVRGLEAAQKTTIRVLSDLSAGRRASYIGWDLEADRLGERIDIEPGPATIIEGCGTLNPDTRPLVDFAIWVEADGGERERLRRVIAREGEQCRQWWDAWAEQDLARLGTDHPTALADVVVRG